MTTLPRRIEILRRSPAFSALDEEPCGSLAREAEELEYPDGTPVVREDEPGDCAYMILEGRAEVSAAGADAPVLLAIIGEGELFGELALFSGSGHRAATVTAVTLLRLLKISGAGFKRAVDAEPEALRRLAAAADAAFAMRFLKLCASPFSALPQEQFRRLASKLKQFKLPAGEIVVRQGESGDSCFVIRSGQVEVVLKEEGTERVLATLDAGALFGETSLLTESLRNTTVRTLKPCELLVLERCGLDEVLGKAEPVVAQLKELVEMRARPRQSPGIEAHPNVSLAGEAITILKDPARGAYYRLSPQGWFIWQRLDGRHHLKDLALDYLREFKAFAPQAIIEIVAGLTRAGFVEGTAFRAVVSARERPGPWLRLLKAARSILEFQVTLRNVDKPLARLYAAGIRLLYTRVGQTALALISAAGVFAFISDTARAGQTLRETGPRLLLFLIPAQLLSLAIHEAGHAFTTKAAGREVLGIGIGWFWFGPVAFVDTSDTWLATRWQRVAVNCAGAYANLILGSCSALAVHAVSGFVAQAALWQFALASYAMVLINMNPLLEFDGYYILTDLLDRPNLRPQSMAWLGRGLLPALRDPKKFSGHLCEIFFSLGSILYVAAMAVTTALLYRAFFQDWLSRLVPIWASTGLSWALGAAVVLLSLANILGDMRGPGSKG